MDEVINVKQEDSEAKVKEKKTSIPCKYFHKLKGCRRGNKCWFYHDLEENKSIKLKQNQSKKFKVQPNRRQESMQEKGSNLKQVILEMLKLLLSENDI